MKNKLLIIAIVAVIGFSMVTCKDDDGGGSGGGGGGSGGGNSGRWIISGIKNYTVTDGVASVSSEIVYNYTLHRYTSDTNYEYQYTTTTTTYVSSPNTSSSTGHETRNGQNYTYTSEATASTGTSTVNQTILYDSAGNQSQYTSENTSTTINTDGTSASTSSRTTVIYDSATGLAKETSISSTNALGTTSTSELVYTIQLLSDSGGVKTYKYYMSSLMSNGASTDVSTQGYSEYQIQDRKTLELKQYTSAGVLISRTTYTYTNDTTVTNTYDKDNNFIYSLTSTTTKSDDPIIRAKLGDYTLSSSELNYPSNPSNNSTSYQTVEVLSDSATTLEIRVKAFSKGVLSSQVDYTYIKVN